VTEHDSLAAALVAALADLTVVEADHQANAGSYSYRYADLADVVKRTRPKLAEHGLVALTPVHDHGTGLACTVTLLHSSGERMDLGPFPFPFGRDAQATGSMVTYHRRYSLVAALGMAVGQDDDGASAVAAQEPQDDPRVPGLRSSIEGAIARLTDAQKADLREWFAEQDLPPVRALNRQQADRVLAHLIDLPVGGGDSGAGPELSATNTEPPASLPLENEGGEP
jgi:hypothetical protein